MGIRGLWHMPLYRRGVWGKYSMYTVLCSPPKKLNYAHTAIMTWHGSSEFTLKISWTGWIFTRIPLEQILTSTAICGKRTYPGSELEMLGVRWGTLASLFLLPKWLHGSSILANLDSIPSSTSSDCNGKGKLDTTAIYLYKQLLQTPAILPAAIYNARTLIIKVSPNCNGLHKCMHNLYIRICRFLLVCHVVVSCLLCHNLIIIPTYIDRSFKCTFSICVTHTSGFLIGCKNPLCFLEIAV